MINIRKKLEQQIIAAVVLDSTAIDALKFLTEKNFQCYEFDHRLIWQTIKEMEGKVLIDMSTVAYKIHAKYGKDYLHYLIDISNQVASSAHVMEHSAILVQIDLKEKFINMLRILVMHIGISESDRALVSEVLKEVEQLDEPIWNLATGAQKMLESKQVNQLIIKELELFNSNVNIKLDHIRKESNKTYVIHALSKLCKTDLQRMYYNQLIQSL
jgi:hypothetical protein